MRLSISMIWCCSSTTTAKTAIRKQEGAFFVSEATDRPENRRVLAVFPHPDDMEILCAGTLLRLCEQGYELHVATMTAGDKGSAERSRPEIAAIRREEARKGAATVG